MPWLKRAACVADVANGDWLECVRPSVCVCVLFLMQRLQIGPCVSKPECFAVWNPLKRAIINSCPFSSSSL